MNNKQKPNEIEKEKAMFWRVCTLILLFLFGFYILLDASKAEPWNHSQVNPPQSYTPEGWCQHLQSFPAWVQYQKIISYNPLPDKRFESEYWLYAQSVYFYYTDESQIPFDINQLPRYKSEGYMVKCK